MKEKQLVLVNKTKFKYWPRPWPGPGATLPSSERKQPAAEEAALGYRAMDYLYWYIAKGKTLVYSGRPGPLFYGSRTGRVHWQFGFIFSAPQALLKVMGVEVKIKLKVMAGVGTRMGSGGLRNRLGWVGQCQGEIVGI